MPAPRPRPVVYLAGRWRDAVTGRYAPAPPSAGGRAVRWDDTARRWRDRITGGFAPAPTRRQPLRGPGGRFLPSVAGAPSRDRPSHPTTALNQPIRYQQYIARNRGSLVDRYGEARVRQAEQEIRAVQAGRRTDLQRAAGVGANRYAMPSFEPGGSWARVSRWDLVAGSRDVVGPTNLRPKFQLAYTRQDEVMAYIRDAGLADSPEYYAVLRSPSGLYYVFIAPSSRSIKSHIRAEEAGSTAARKLTPARRRQVNAPPADRPRASRRRRR